MTSRQAYVALRLLGFWLLMVRLPAQGVLEFSNRGYDWDDTPVFGPDGCLGLSGPRYSAQLLAGTNGTPAESLVPVGAPQPFDRHGFWISTNLVIPGVANNQIASLQVRVWDNENGRYPTFESAALKASSARFTHRLNRQSPWDAMARMGSFSLPPGRPLPHPAESWLGLLAINYGAGGGFGGNCDPGDPADFDLSGRGNLLHYTRYYPCQEPGVSRTLTDLAAQRDLAVPQPAEIGDYPGFGPGRWTWTSMSSDGAVLLGNVSTTNGSQGRAYLGLSTNAVALPMNRGSALSGDGRFVFGTKPDGTWIRLEIATGSELRILVPEGITNPVFTGVSEDGDSWLVSSGGGTGQAWWRRGTGWRILGPADPAARHLSADGGTVTGVDRVTFDPVLLSADGTRRSVPEAKPLGRPIALCDAGRLLWCERGVLDLHNGQSHDVGELLRGSARSQFRVPGDPRSRIPLEVQSVRAVDQRGRTIVFRATSVSSRFGASRVGYWYVARLALPDDGAPLSFVRSGSERFRVRFPARTGIRYRVESSRDFRNWDERVAEHEGVGADEEIDVDTSGDGGEFLRIRATVVPP
jgi:hypothetical protein